MPNILLIPIVNIYFLGNLLSYVATLSLSGMGIFIAYKSGAFNLGGEGQIYFGGFLATIVGIYLLPSYPPFISKSMMFFVAFLTGGILALISGYLKYYFKVSEFISTFLISETMIIVTNVILRTYFHDPAYGITATLPLSKGLLFKKLLPPSFLSTSIFISLILVLLVAFVYNRSVYGYEFKMFGICPWFAFYGGIDIKKAMLIPLFISGGILGFTGILDILARNGRFVQGFSYGLGWDGIIVFLLARGNPYWIIPSALLLSYIKVLVQVGGIYNIFPLEVGGLLKAIIFLIATVGTFSYLEERDV